MSDDDFFDSPREGELSNKYNWSGDGSSEKQFTETNSVRSCNTALDGMGKAKGVRKLSISDSESDSGLNPTSKYSCGSSKQFSVTKIPTTVDKSHEYTSNSSESDNDNPQQFSKTDVHKSRSSSRSNSLSSRSRSTSKSRSVSSSSRSCGGSNNGSKQAWTVDSQTKPKVNKRSVRPKTSHHRNRQQRLVPSTSEDREDKLKSNSKDERKTDSSSLSETESGSDMTDVSPLTSPKRGYPFSDKNRTNTTASPSSNGRHPLNKMHTDLYSDRKVRPRSAVVGGYEHLLQSDSDSMNLKALMHTLLEMEHGQEDNLQRKEHRKFKQAPHSDAGTLPNPASYGLSRKNFSFTNTRVKDIDRENQRLMNKILKQGIKPKKFPDTQKPRKPMYANYRLTSSAVNRFKDQQRIEQENRAMLKRLEKTKPTKTLQKDNMREEMVNTTYAGVPLGVIHSIKPRSTSRLSSKSPYKNISRSEVSSVMSDENYIAGRSIKSSKQQPRPRPKSAHAATGIRATSSTPNFKAKRPEWEAGW